MISKKNLKLLLGCGLICLLAGCGTSNQEIPEDTPVDENTVIYEESWEDLDGNGKAEYIKVTNTEKGVLELFYNGQVIYKYEEAQERIAGISEKAFTDLDGDGKKEIFVSFTPTVNSMPLTEWFVLKETDGSWERLEMYHEEADLLNNAFPVSVVLVEPEYLFAIRCDGYEGEILYDATAHYDKKESEKEMGDSSFDFFKGQNYKAGDMVGTTSDWGIWNIAVGSYENQNCLIAEHGLNGLAGSNDFFGQVFVYFDYDTEGMIRILHMSFEESK